MTNLAEPLTHIERLRLALAVSDGNEREFECEPEYLEALLADYDRQAAALAAKDAEIAKLMEERDNLLEQIALRQPSAVERDMQEVMRINNALRAALEPFAGLGLNGTPNQTDIDRARGVLSGGPSEEEPQ